MNSYKELPSNYIKDYEIDAKDTKTGIILNVATLILALIVGVLAFVLKFDEFKNALEGRNFTITFGFVLSMIVYVILHELTHGIFYKLFTKEKLTYGFSWSCAYCGVPNVYCNKKTTVVACLAPFVLFTILFVTLIIILPQNYLTFLLIILFAIHFGGCSGDLYLSLKLIFKYKNDVFINDTGAKQSIYIKKEENNE